MNNIHLSAHYSTKAKLFTFNVEVDSMRKDERKRRNIRIFLKTAFLTAIAICLIVLGVISANYLFS